MSSSLGLCWWVLGGGLPGGRGDHRPDVNRHPSGDRATSCGFAITWQLDNQALKAPIWDGIPPASAIDPDLHLFRRGC